MKRIFSLFIAIILAFSVLTVYTNASGDTVFDNVCGTVSLAIDEERNSSAPIKLVKATLTSDNGTSDIYLIGLVGTHTHEKQVNIVGNYLLAVFCLNTSYTELVREVIRNNIESGASIVLVGHSLGGMVAQQIAADPNIKDNYNIIATVTAGSPYMFCSSDTEGLLTRLADKSDIIPKVGLATIFAPAKQFSEAITKDGGYGLDLSGAHNESYIDPTLWGQYDALGVQNGSAKITFNKSDMKLFGEVK